MAKLNVVNTKLDLPIYERFTASQPVISSCYFQNNPTITINNRSYYYDGTNEPKVGDTIFLDINGIDKYTFSLSYVQFKEDSNNFYYLEIINSIVVTIIVCPKIEYTEFDMLDQTSSEICKENSFYPSNLETVADIFYHDGEGEFPVLGDTIYNSTLPSDTLNNIIGLFKILNNVYYYLYTDNNGKVINIKTCSKPIIFPTRNISISPVTNIIDGDYTQFNCEVPGTPRDTLYYKSETDTLPIEGTKVYSDFNLTNLITNTSYYINKVDDTIYFLLVNNEGEVSYTNCKVITNPPIEEPDPDPISNYYFYGKDVSTICTIPRSITRYYYDRNAGGGNGQIPPLLTVIYDDSSLSVESKQVSKIIYLYTTNNIAYYLLTNANGEYFSTRTCDIRNSSGNTNQL